MSTDIEREEFSRRLKMALNNAKIRNDSPTEVARAFNSATLERPITVHAARKWLVGEAIPTQFKVRELANMTGVDVSWLRFGSGEPTFVSPKESVRESSLKQYFSMLSDKEQEIVLNLVRSMALLRSSDGKVSEG